jgi:hypothetical protein
MTASLRFAQSNSAGLPCYKCFAAGSSTYPCHMACISKSVTKDIISLSDYIPNSTEAPWMRRAILSIPFSRLSGSGALSSPLLILLSLHKVVLFWYSLCIWLPCRKRDAGANTSNKTGRLQNPLLMNQKKGNSWLRTREKLSSYAACQ